MSKKILMIAGPNGAGKTSLALELMAACPLLYEYINADDIARSLAPIHPETMALTASKLMIKRLQELLSKNESFAFETTASGKNYIKYLEMAKAKGYEINISFLWLESADQAVQRVLQRVEQGGHYVPDDVVRRRYDNGLKNMIHHYLPLADSVFVINNSNEEALQKVIAQKDQGSEFIILDDKIWQEIMRIVQ